jgi:AraC-like DNA-binding protein
MVKVGTDEKVYPVAKIGLVVDALRESGVAPDEALQGAHVSAAELNSPAARISLNQVLEVYRNAVRLAPHPQFAYLTGLSGWLDAPATLGNPITYPSVVGLCDALLEELELRSGLAGQVRGVLARKLGHETSLASVSEQLKVPPRTLRRRLLEEGTSFREIGEHLRTQLAVKYLRDTDLSVEDIAFALGFSDAANFRHAFRRWTDKSPNEFRNRSGARRTD